MFGCFVPQFQEVSTLNLVGGAFIISCPKLNSQPATDQNLRPEALARSLPKNLHSVRHLLNKDKTCLGEEEKTCYMCRSFSLSLGIGKKFSPTTLPGTLPPATLFSQWSMIPERAAHSSGGLNTQEPECLGSGLCPSWLGRRLVRHLKSHTKQPNRRNEDNCDFLQTSSPGVGGCGRVANKQYRRQAT